MIVKSQSINVEWRDVSTAGSSTGNYTALIKDEIWPGYKICNEWKTDPKRWLNGSWWEGFGILNAHITFWYIGMIPREQWQMVPRNFYCGLDTWTDHVISKSLCEKSVSFCVPCVLKLLDLFFGPRVSKKTYCDSEKRQNVIAASKQLAVTSDCYWFTSNTQLLKETLLSC